MYLRKPRLTVVEEVERRGEEGRRGKRRGEESDTVNTVFQIPWISTSLAKREVVALAHVQMDAIFDHLPRKFLAARSGVLLEGRAAQ